MSEECGKCKFWMRRSDVVPTKIAPNCSATFHVYHLRDLRVKEAIPMPVSSP